MTGLFALVLSLVAVGEPPAAELLDVRKIWDAAPHNAFTDLVRFQDRWYCVFREGQDHVSADGTLRVIRSADGRDWTSVAHLRRPGADLRDAKITTTPDGRLMLSGAACIDVPARRHHQSLAWFSGDGTNWTGPVAIGRPDDWLWRVSWHQDKAYAIGYATDGPPNVRLYVSPDGREFQTLVDALAVPGDANESSILFLPDESALCLLRRDREPSSALLGTAAPPYTTWNWKDLGARVGGPHLLRLPDGRIVAAGRLHDGRVRTGLGLIDPDSGSFIEWLALPSGGDTSYPGLVHHDGLVWVSYYSSHEGKTSIYLARVKVNER